MFKQKKIQGLRKISSSRGLTTGSRLVTAVKPRYDGSICVSPKIFILFIFLLFNNYLLAWEVDIASYFEGGGPSYDNNENISGYRISASNFFYNYKDFIKLGVNGSIAYSQTSTDKYKTNFSKNIIIVSPAIVLKIYPIKKSQNIKMFIEAGVGPSYMSNDDFAGHSLGSRFAFQDIGAVGAQINKNFIMGLYLIHYSNAGLAKKNRGITLPLAIRFGYKF